MILILMIGTYHWGQAEAIIFFLIILVVAIIQVVSGKRKEVEA